MCVAMGTTYCECVTITKIQEINLSEIYFWYIRKLLAYIITSVLLLLSRFSRVQLCANP